jgi:hypothetical protein
MKNTLLILSLILISTNLFAQKITISGYITDKESGERLINANVYNKDTYLGTTANSFGYYSISLPKGKINMVASFIGYQPQEFNLNPQEDLVLNIELEIRSDELDEVTVIGNQVNKVVYMYVVVAPIRIYSYSMECLFIMPATCLDFFRYLTPML